MSAYFPCHMQAMPEMMAAIADPQDSPEVHTISSCQMNDMVTSNDLPEMTQSCCDMSGNGDCSTASTLPFISISKLVVANSGQTAAVLYFPASLPEQHPESLYRPPLIV